jgi:hypothetical protein
MGVFATLGGIGFVIWNTIRHRNFEHEQEMDDHLPMPE